ncbi:hypothetical protein VP22O281_P0014 [Vibrio phage 22O28-1]|nr:hypothetical protein VP22O281_P0014 [Vibrio phage 22O28-1]
MQLSFLDHHLLAQLPLLNYVLDLLSVYITNKSPAITV